MFIQDVDGDIRRAKIRLAHFFVQMGQFGGPEAPSSHFSA